MKIIIIFIKLNLINIYNNLYLLLIYLQILSDKYKKKKFYVNLEDYEKKIIDNFYKNEF